MDDLNAFVAEGNVEIYLAKLRASFDRAARDTLLRLLVLEQSRMGESRLHLENGERRLADGRARIARQRELVARLTEGDHPTGTAILLLDTLEKTQVLLDAHCQRLHEAFERGGP